MLNIRNVIKAESYKSWEIFLMKHSNRELAHLLIQITNRAEGTLSSLKNA